MKDDLARTCRPAARRFQNLKTRQIRCLMALKLGENDRERLKTLEPGGRVDYFRIRDNANLAAELGTELILRRLLNQDHDHE